MDVAKDLLVQDARLKAEETFARQHIKELEEQLALLRSRVAEISAERQRLFPSATAPEEARPAVIPEAPSTVMADPDKPKIKTDRHGFVTHWNGNPLFPRSGASKKKK